MTITDSSMTPSVADIAVVVLAESLTSLRDRLWDDGFHEAADLVADLVTRCELYVERWASGG